jgi:hypothetical protein
MSETTLLEEIAARAELLAQLPAVNERATLREKARVSQREAARAIGVTPGWLRRFETGLGVRLTDEKLMALTKLYDACRGQV